MQAGWWEEGNDKGKGHSLKFLAVFRDVQAGGCISWTTSSTSWVLWLLTPAFTLPFFFFFFSNGTRKEKKVLSSQRKVLNRVQYNYPFHSLSVMQNFQPPAAVSHPGSNTLLKACFCTPTNHHKKGAVVGSAFTSSCFKLDLYSIATCVYLYKNDWIYWGFCLTSVACFVLGYGYVFLFQRADCLWIGSAQEVWQK